MMLRYKNGSRKFLRITEGDRLWLEDGCVLVNNVLLHQKVVDDGEEEVHGRQEFEVTLVDAKSGMVVLEGDMDLDFNDERNWGKVSMAKEKQDGWAAFDNWVRSHFTFLELSK